MSQAPEGWDVEKLQMKFDLNVLQHLGLKMYTSLPAVVSEYVANAWDAWAKEVDISIPEETIDPDYKITISDNGSGMTPKEVNEKFLIVGRNRREDENKDYSENSEGDRRPVMGRKGIGKLAGFGVADVVRIETRKDGMRIEFELDYGEMRKKAKDDPTATTTYNPAILDIGPTDEECGTDVILTNLNMEQRPASRYVRQRLARRFTVVGDDFDVRVNGESVTGDERNLKQRCQFLRIYDDASISEDSSLTIDGWIGTFHKPIPDNIQGGVAVMARGKTAQKPITFGVGEGGTTGQQALQYLVGEIHADFLDDEEDLIATHRTEVRWGKSPADELYAFIASEIKDFISEWPGKRKIDQVEKIRGEKPYQQYIKPLDERERELADDFLGDLAKRGYDDEMLEDMASYVSSGVQQKAFSELIREIDESDISNTDRLVELFDRYEVLDAMNSLRIVKGRSKAIEKFEQLVEDSDADIDSLHGFVSDNPWLIDPRWDYLDEEVELRQKISDNFSNSEQEDRVGFICLGDSDTVRLVDIREPGHILDEGDLTEFKQYVDYLRALQGMEPLRDREVEGYIISNGTRDTRDVDAEVRRMKMDDMRIRTYDNIKKIAKRSHQAFLQVFERKADRTGSDMLRSHLDSAYQSDIDEFV